MELGFQSLVCSIKVKGGETDLRFTTTATSLCVRYGFRLHYVPLEQDLSSQLNGFQEQLNCHRAFVAEQLEEGAGDMCAITAHGAFSSCLKNQSRLLA
eukprot:4393999-Amphidinium_carterae.1